MPPSLTRPILFCLVAAAAIPAAAQDWRSEVPQLRLGLMTGANPGYAMAWSEPLILELEARLGVDVELAPAADYPSLIAAQAAGVEVTFLTAAAFVEAAATCACVEPFAVPTDPSGNPGYHAILVVPAGSPIDAVDDLRGMRLAVSAEDSVAGRLLPLRLFAEAGVAESDLTLVARPSPALAVEAVLMGEADAALAWSSLSGSEAGGYDRGVLTQMVADGRLAMSMIRVPWSSPLIPYGPVAVRTSLPDALKTELFDALAGIASDNPEALAAVTGTIGGGFVAGDPALFEPLALLAR